MESLFERLLREKLILMLDMRIEAMTSGLSSFEEYRHSLGYIEALRNVLSAIDEVQSDVRKE
jgi:hypothetical protein